MPNIKTLILAVSEKKNFEVVFSVPMFQLVTPWAGPVLTPQHHMNKLGRGPQGDVNTKYQSSMPSSSEEKNFEDRILCSYVPTCDPMGVANLDPRTII